MARAMSRLLIEVKPLPNASRLTFSHPFLRTLFHLCRIILEEIEIHDLRDAQEQIRI